MATRRRDRVNPATQDQPGDYAVAVYKGSDAAVQAVRNLIGQGIRREDIKVAAFDAAEHERLKQIEDVGAEVSDPEDVAKDLVDEDKQRREADRDRPGDAPVESGGVVDNEVVVPVVAAPYGTAGAWTGSSSTTPTAGVAAGVPLVAADMDLFGGNWSRDRGLFAALIGLGVSEEEARHFETAFAHGTVLVVVRAPGQVAETRQRLQELGGDVAGTKSTTSSTARQVANPAQAGSPILDE